MSRKHLGKMVAAVAFASVMLVPAAAQAAELAPRSYENGKLLSATHIPAIGVGNIQLVSEVIGEVKCTNTFYGEGWNQLVGGETRGVGEIDGWGTSSCTAPTYVPSLELADKKQIEKKEVACQNPSAIPTEIGKGKCFTVFASAEEPLETEKAEAEVCKTEGKKLSECTGAGEKQTVKLTSAVRRRVASTPWKAELARAKRNGGKVIIARTGLHAFGESAAEVAQEEKGTCYPKEGGQPANWKAVPSGCVVVNIIFPQIPDEIVFYGTQEGEAINGSKNGLSPSVQKLELHEEPETGSGYFYSSEDSAGEINQTEGEIKTLGVNAIELLTAK